MNNHTLTTLVEKAILGDEKAFEQICQAKATDILYMCIHYMGNQQDGEDAAQEVMLEMHKSIRRLRKPEAFPAWVNKLTANTCIGFIRKRNRRKDIPYDYLDLHSVPELQLEFLPQDFAEEAEKRQVVLDAMKAIGFKHKQVLLLFYYEGLSTKQVAQVMEITPKAAERALYRARAVLKKQIGKRLHTDLGATANTSGHLGGACVLTRILRADVAALQVEESTRTMLGVVGAVVGTAGGIAIGTQSAAFSAGAAAGIGPIATITAFVAAAAAVTVVGSSLSIGSPAPLATPVPQQVVAQVAGLPDKDEAYTPQPESSPTQELSIGEVTKSSPSVAATSYPPQDMVAAMESAEPSTLSHSTGSTAKAMPPISTSAKENTGAVSTEDTTFEDILPDVPERESGGESGGEPSENPVPPALEDEPPEVTVVQARLVLLHTSGAQVDPSLWPVADTLITCLLASGEEVLLVPEADGSFAVETQPGTEAVTLVVQAPTGLQTKNETDGIYTLAPCGEVYEILLEDTMPPAGVIRLYSGTGTQTQSSVNPATAHLTVFEETCTTMAWQVQSATGLVQHSGTGQQVALHNLPEGSYTILFTITDSAGNTTTVERDIVMS